ncbi:MAG: alpha/beta hydrolase [Pseudomonadota bacterium]|nr:alpha/beta hydrolase [Pseudomonadota bacterium]
MNESAGDAGFATIAWRGAAQRIEYRWVGAAVGGDAGAPLDTATASSARPNPPAVPTVVFLHEGLGSVAMWKDFPRSFCAAHGLRGFVFSRPGYGRSTPKPQDERWAPDFMHRQADQVLPALFTAVGIDTPWLFGHSDGASIALLHAAAHAVAGVVAVAPHLFVEAVSVASIERARDAYETGGLRARLARHHDDPDSAFRGWNDAWLNPAFRGWNIEPEIASITAPVLAVQGEDDEYGTLAQIEAIARRLPKTRLLAIPDCGHSPHRDQPATLSREAGRFILEHHVP